MSAKAHGSGGNPLPETFETFAETRRCETCKDRVEPRFFDEESGECVGCRHGGDV